MRRAEKAGDRKIHLNLLVQAIQAAHILRTDNKVLFRIIRCLGVSKVRHTALVTHHIRYRSALLSVLTKLGPKGFSKSYWPANKGF